MSNGQGVLGSGVALGAGSAVGVEDVDDDDDDNDHPGPPPISAHTGTKMYHKTRILG